MPDNLKNALLNMAKKILGIRTETETVELALESIISESEKNKIAFKATENFLKSGIEIEDVFGNLEG